MKIIKITPRGFCFGVVNAWKIVLETIKQNPTKTIYMLGWFVHNQKMLDEIKVDNLIILDDKKTSRYELVKNINVKDGDILLLSAHGTDEKTKQLALNKGLNVIDTTCDYVYKTHDVIKQALKENKTVIYLGKENHPESLAAISISNKIIFISSFNELEKLTHLFDKEVVVTNQTTLSIYDLKQYYDFINNHFTKCELKNDLCIATQERQEALINLKEKIDVLIVVGDTRSNNSQQLLKIGYHKKIPHCYLVNDLEEVKCINFKPNDVIAITSGASTPTKLTNEIIKYLESIS